MPCNPIKNADGHVTAIVCGRATVRKRCACGKRVTKLCDFFVDVHRTCDRGMCSGCATSVGHDRDYCHEHVKASGTSTSKVGER